MFSIQVYIIIYLGQYEVMENESEIMYSSVKTSCTYHQKLCVILSMRDIWIHLKFLYTYFKIHIK